MKKEIIWISILTVSIWILPANIANAQAFTENFDDISLLTASGWYMQNNSSPAGILNWFQGTSVANAGPFDAYNGVASAYIAANFNNTSSTGTISNWLVTPSRTLRNGDVISFYTRKATPDNYPDRLQVRLSLNGTSTNVGTGSGDVGDFTTLLLDINPTLTTGVYPTTWTSYTLTISGLTAPTTGRIAFRYFVTNGGPTGVNSDYIGIDNVVYTPYVCPEISISPLTLPDATAGTSYSQSLSQTGALGTPSYYVSAGNIPAIISLGSNGLLSGVPVDTGDFNFTVTVGDASGCAGSQAFTLTVNCPVNGASLNITPSQVCSNDGMVTIAGGSPDGGTYSGSGVTGTDFDVSMGTQSIVYTFTDEYGCEQQASDEITVKVAPLVIASVDDPDSTVCFGSSVVLFGQGADEYSWNNDVTDTVPFYPDITKDYVITGSDTVTGCSSTDTITVKVNDLPEVNLPAFDFPVYTNSGAITLTDGTPSGGDFSGDGVSDHGFDPSIGAGSYPIIYTFTDANGCVNSDTATLNISIPSAIENRFVTGGIKVYPNPGQGNFTIEFDQEAAARLEIRITNLLGRIVTDEIYPDFSGKFTKQFDLIEAERGLYLLEVISGESKITSKIILQ